MPGGAAPAFKIRFGAMLTGTPPGRLGRFTDLVQFTEKKVVFWQQADYILCTWHQVPSTKNLVPSTSTKYLVLGTKHQVLSTWYLVPSTKY